MRKKLSVIISMSIMVVMLAACGSANKPASSPGDVLNGTGKEESSFVNTSKDTTEDIIVSNPEKAESTVTPEPEKIEPQYGQTVNEWISILNKTPKYLIFNSRYKCLYDLIEENKMLLLDTQNLAIYFGDNDGPVENEKMFYIKVNFDETIKDKSLDEIIKDINNCAVICDLDYNEFEEIIFGVSEIESTKVSSPLKVGSTLSQCIPDFAVSMDENAPTVLPFEIYEVCTNGTLDNSNFEDLIVKDLLGKINSIMIIKMKEVETFDLILKYSTDPYLSKCRPGDVYSYKCIATGLTEEEVLHVVNVERLLNTGYEYLIPSNKISIEPTEQMLWEYSLKQNNIPKYFIFNRYSKEYEQINNKNRFFLMENPIVYVYFGKSEELRKGEQVVVVQIHYDGEFVDLDIDRAIKTIRNSKIVAIEKFNP